MKRSFAERQVDRKTRGRASGATDKVRFQAEASPAQSLLLCSHPSSIEVRGIHETRRGVGAVPGGEPTVIGTESPVAISWCVEAGEAHESLADVIAVPS